MKKKITAILTVILLLSSNIAIYAGTGDVFSAGCSMRPVGGDPAINSINEATLAGNEFKKANLNLQLTTKPTVSQLKNYLDSSVVYLAGHGSQINVSWPYINSSTTVEVTTAQTTGSNSYSVQGKYFNNIDVAILAACSAGAAGGLASYLQQRGATTTFGWRVQADDVAMKDYGILMAKHLSNGKTVQNAVISSTSDMVAGKGVSGLKWDAIYGTYPDTTKPYFQTAIYGDVNNTITNRRNVESLENSTITTPGKDITIYAEIPDLDYTVNSNDITSISDYIREAIDPDFDLSLFAFGEAEVIEDSGCSIITFRYKVGDFVSDFGYNVIVVDNTVEEIVRVGKPLYDMPMPQSIDMMEEKYNSFISDNQNTISEDTIVDVYYEKQYQSETGDFIVRTVTTYKDENEAFYCIGENTVL